MNCIAIVGRLTADPELKTTGAGVKVCTITVAVNRSYVKQGEERKADFFTVVLWRQQAEMVAKFFRKGNYIAIDGSMEARRYEDKNGVQRTAWELIAAHVSFCESKTKSEPPAVETPPTYYEVPDEEAFPF